MEKEGEGGRRGYFSGEHHLAVSIATSVNPGLSISNLNLVEILVGMGMVYKISSCEERLQLGT